jgi:hypothetical protein
VVCCSNPDTFRSEDSCFLFVFVFLQVEKPLQHHGGRLEHNETYCGSCYGAQEVCSFPVTDSISFFTSNLQRTLLPSMLHGLLLDLQHTWI